MDMLKLSGGDVIAQELQSHADVLLAFQKDVGFCLVATVGRRSVGKLCPTVCQTVTPPN